MRIVFVGCLCVFAWCAQLIKPMDFEVFKMGESSPTLLLVGGVHGDEPGGYNAPNIILMHYRILKGSLWVVPALSKHSMFSNHRGIYNDLNRKFASSNPKDPEYKIIQDTKKLINNKQIDIIFYLHDGSGYYRPTWQNALLNPNRWGNCIVIDQDELANTQYGELLENATFITDYLNKHLLDPIHTFNVHNTYTIEKNNTAMAKALTLYSLLQNKPAYTSEASKEIDVQTRVYYHLLAIEALLQKVGIEFERDFDLNPQNIKALINDPKLTFKLEHTPDIPFFGLRGVQKSFPFPKGKDYATLKIDSQAKILGFIPQRQYLTLKYGGTTLTNFVPQYIDFDTSLQSIQAFKDNNKESIPIDSRVQIQESISFEPLENYEIKIVGLPHYTPSLPITKAMLNPSLSMDISANLYRAEFYKIIPLELESSSKDSVLDSTLLKDVDSTPLAKDVKNAKKAKVIVNIANVRTEPNTQSKIIAKAPLNRELYILDSANGWAKIQYQFKDRLIEGYIFENLLEVIKPKVKREFSGMIILDFTPTESSTKSIQSAPESKSKPQKDLSK